MQLESGDHIGTNDDLAAHMLRKSTKKLRCAEEDYKRACKDGVDGDFDDSASRSYYAVLFAIQALHAMEGKAFARHGQAVGEFNKTYIKTGVFDRSYGTIIMDMMMRRHAGDYDPKIDISKSSAKECLDWSKKITTDIKKYFTKQYSKAWRIYKKICPQKWEKLP